MRLGIRNAERGITAGLHHDNFDIDEDALETGVSVFTQFVLDNMNGIPDLPTEQYGEILQLISDVRRFAPDAHIGLSLPLSFLEAPDATVIDSLAASFSFLALDLSDYDTHTVSTTGEDGTVTRTSATLPQILDLLEPAIRRYQMRLILPVSMYEQLITVQDLGYDSWQIIR